MTAGGCGLRETLGGWAAISVGPEAGEGLCGCWGMLLELTQSRTVAWSTGLSISIPGVWELPATPRQTPSRLPGSVLTCHCV